MIRAEWRPREPPLAPVAAAGTGAVARALAERLLREPDDALARVSLVVSRELLVVLGSEPPWVDGATFLGREPDAPELLVPTHAAPSVPPELLLRALARRAGAGPLALLPETRTVVPLSGARPPDRAELRRWLARGDAE